MLYPFGMVMTWLCLSVLVNDVGENNRSRFIVYLLFSGGVVFLLVILFYAPIFAVSGLNSVVGNGFVAALGWSEFWESIPARIKNTWREWNTGLPPAMGWFLVAGLSVAAIPSRLKKSHRISLATAAFIWITAVLLIQRVAPWPRVWLFLLPLLLITAAAGIVSLARILQNWAPAGKYLAAAILAIALIVPLGGSLVVNSARYLQSRGNLGEIEEVTVFLKDYLTAQDVVLVTSPDGVLLRYYFRRYRLSEDYTSDVRDQDFLHALVVVNQSQGQTIESVLKKRAFTGKVDPGTARLIYQSNRILIYELTRDLSQGNY
jgi:hypothetical protein